MLDLPPLLKAALQLRAETDLSRLFLPAMTEPPEPNDLSHLSDEEFMALCPLGEHAPGPEPLSPAAQAVLDAYGHEVGGTAAITSYERHGIAAALRALCRTSTDEAMVRGWICKVLTTEDILAIAAELEGHHG